MLNNTKITNAATCAVAALFMAHPAWALNNRSWVVSFGSDNNNCTAFFPCKTFQRAHDVTVDGGEVDVLDAGDYGGLLISKSITIDGGNMGYIQTSVAFVPAIIVDAPPTGKVILRNLSIGSQPPVAGNTSGIVWFTGQALSIEGVSIYGVETGITVGPPITDFGAPRLLIKDVTIRNCSVTGIEIIGFANNTGQHPTTTEATMDHVTIENTPTGVYVAEGKANIIHSVFSHASVGGVATQTEINLDDSSVFYSARGVRALGANAIVRIAGDNIHDNTVALETISGGQIVSFGNNRIQGNGSGESPTSTTALK